ncbi:MAG TPA: OB-fold domain-containing protein [Ilumatobacteraceae bacterium]|nr:OB-fold domain-containing protein [Ilumatobacteraceae bacterium]
MSAFTPAPHIDQYSQPFWDGLANRRILLQSCGACGRRRFPRLPSCPYCATPGGDDIEISGAGTVYSFVRAHRALTGASQSLVPYSVATIDLDGGARLLGRVVPPDRCAIGVRVTADFVDHPASESSDGWTELYFRIVGDQT